MSQARETLDRLLGYLTFLHGAQGGAVLHVEHGHPVVELTRSVRAGRLCDLSQVWPSALPMLREGTTVGGDDYVLAPLSASGVLVGALFLDAPSRFDGGGTFGRICEGMAVKLVEARKAGPETQLPQIVSPQVKLEAELERYGWNLSRAAKALGVTRRTVYLHMRKFGIERPR